MAKITPEDIRADHAEAVRLRLFNADKLEDAEYAAQVCNGVGPEWMPAAMRKLIDLLNPVMVLPSRIHDVEYAIGGDEADRQVADTLFHSNVLFVIEDRYAWYNPMRYIMVNRAGRFYEYLRIFGKAAYNYKDKAEK